MRHSRVLDEVGVDFSAYQFCLSVLLLRVSPLTDSRAIEGEPLSKLNKGNSIRACKVSG